MDKKTADFRSELAPNGQIAVPPDIAWQVPPGAQIQVVLQVGHLRKMRCMARRGRAAIRSGLR